MISRYLKKAKNFGFRRLFLRAVIKTVQYPRVVFYRFLSDADYSLDLVRLNQPAIFCGRGSINLSKCVIGIWPSPLFFNTYAHIESRSSTASITIGAGTYLNNNVIIIADRASISIGKDVLIGHNTFITDSDFHGLTISDRLSGKYECKSVTIDNGVFVGSNVTILKGVNIGENSVVAANSVVVTDVPKNALVAGVPAKIVKYLNN